MVNITTERTAEERGRSKWKLELIVSDQPGNGTRELATRLGLALLIWSAKLPGYEEEAFLRAIVGDAEKLKMVLGLVGCVGELEDPLPLDKTDVRMGKTDVRRVHVGPVLTEICQQVPHRTGLIIFNAGPGTIEVQSPVLNGGAYVRIEPAAFLNVSGPHIGFQYLARECGTTEPSRTTEVRVTEMLP
jgi:hypothetical protein